MGKKYLEKHVFWIMLLGLTFFYSCGSSGPKPASSVNTVTTISIHGYLGLCDVFFEGTKALTVSIDVDILKSDGTIGASHYAKRFFVQNDQADANDVEFSNVTVPEDGSFIITVISEANVCYQCCQSKSCNYDAGRPRFRGQVTFMNPNGVPTTVSVPMKMTSCD